MIIEAAALENGDHLIPVVVLAAKVAPDAVELIFYLAASLAPEKGQQVQIALGLKNLDMPTMIETTKTQIAVDEDKGVEIETATDNPRPYRIFSVNGWTGKAELGGTLNTGNTDEESLFVAGEINRRHGPWNYSLESSFDIKRVEDRTNKQRFVVEGQVNRDISPRAYAYGAVKFEDDAFSGFNYRVTTSGGVGYRLFDDDAFYWGVETGPSVRVDQREGASSANVDVAGRGASDMVWRISESAEVNNDFEVIGDGGVNIDTISALIMRITERLSGKLSYQVRLNTDAPSGRQEMDTTTKASLLYDFQ
jgi:putative salt-induced outer membrane protein